MRNGQLPLPFQTVEQASQSLRRKAQIKSESIFRRGAYLAENTHQAASVEFVRS